jgi:hypothetical protein
MPPWQVLLIVFGTVAVLVFGGCAALTIAIGHSLNGFGKGFNIGPIGPTASAAEMAAASTTVPLTHDDCQTLRRLRPDGTALAFADLADARRNFPAYQDRLSRALVLFDADLLRAIEVAHGPMRTHLANAERNVHAGLASIRAARTYRDYDQLTLAMKGSDELQISEQLLGRTCSSRLVPDECAALSSVMPPPSNGPHSTTTLPSC